jgi:hypothetical protein
MVGVDIEKNAKTVRDILMDEYNWSHLAFVDGMAPVDYSYIFRKQIWKPKSRWFQKLFGGSYGRKIPLENVLIPNCFLKFCIPNEAIQASADYQNWRGYFDRETTYSDISAGHMLDRWVKFLGFKTFGFDFDIEYIDYPVVARTPSIVFFWSRLDKNFLPH